MAAGYRPRAGFEDRIDRTLVGLYLRLTRNQVEGLERRAKAVGKTLAAFLRDTWEAEIARQIPAVAT